MFDSVYVNANFDEVFNFVYNSDEESQIISCEESTTEEFNVDSDDLMNAVNNNQEVKNYFFNELYESMQIIKSFN